MPSKNNFAFDPSFPANKSVANKRTPWVKIIDLEKEVTKVKNLLARAPTIEDYYCENYNPKTSLKIVHNKNSKVKQPMVTYFFSGFMLSRQNENDECRIIECGNMVGPQNSYTADYLIYYSSRKNSITLILKQTNRENERVGDFTDLTRAEMDWDKADIKILLNNYQEIIEVVYNAREMHLSRSRISIILKDINLYDKFPELSKVIKTHLVLPEVDDILRKSELAEEKTVRLTLLSKCRRNPQTATAEEIQEIRRSLFYKSWAIRQNIVKTLMALKKAGKVDAPEIEEAIRRAETRDIKEDFLVIERSIRKDGAFIVATLKAIYDLDITFADVNKIYIEYFDKGKNKQVYKARILLNNKQSYIVAFSVIRYIFKGYTLGEFSDQDLKESIVGWENQSKINPDNVCRLGTYRWYDDFRPRPADSDVKFSREPQIEVDRNRWIYNNLLVVAREFVDGVDLENIINNKNLSASTIKDITAKAIESYLSLWAITNGKKKKGWYLGDPKPANIIIYEEENKIKAKVIDFDALHKNGTLQKYLATLKHLKYDPNLINKVLKKMDLNYAITA